MSTRVTWQASTDPAIASYTLQSSADASTWAPLASITHTVPGPNWDGSVFYYVDAAGTVATWYRLQAVDTLGQTSAWSAAFQASGIPIPRWETVQQIVTAAALEVGLGSAGADVMASTDANVKQLCGLLKSVGRELIHVRDWNYLRKECSFTTVAGQSTYPLPNDFHHMIDQTWWNRTNRLPIGGPLSGQMWQYLRARMVGVVFNVLFRPLQREIVLYPTINTPGGFNIVFEYHSSWWISQAAVPDTSTGDAPTLSTDYVWFDPLLAVRALKLAFLKAKGFDTTSVQQDFNTTLEYMKGADAPSEILNATRRFNPVVDPLIGGQNVPVTGFGS